MVGIFSQKRRTFALIQPLYHPLQTRPTLPFPHIGNYLFIVKVINFYSCPFFFGNLLVVLDQVPHYQHAPQQGARQQPFYFHEG